MTDTILGTELLAPARDLACGKAAIDAGADAVYIGAPRFGARSKAGNELDDIAALVTYAHTFWARVYVTVNTLLYDDELDAAVQLIGELYNVGVDAVIIQDLGLLECDLPPIALIASTQMHNHSPERVRFLEQIGFQRAILARELSLDEIRAIRDATDGIDLEAFVHGALCVGYSGQCYMSYAIGGRSGNRGECAQPCRRKYDLVDRNGRVLVKKRHLLSLRDMNRMVDLETLLDAGVTSFKIEGRLKDATYVTNVVSAYRRALDAGITAHQMRRSSSGQSRIAFTPNVHKTFNRGFTEYFLRGRTESPGAIETPKMIGEYVGTVTEVTRKDFTLQTHVELHNGDGLAFFSDDQMLRGTVINGTRQTAHGVTVIPNSTSGIRIGTRVHRNRDHAFLSEVENHPPVRTIGVFITLREATDGFEVYAEDEDGNEAVIRVIREKVDARKPEQAEATAQKQLAKTGGTPFHCESVALAWTRPFFLPFSTLNEMRRDVLESLLASRASHRPKMTSTITKNTTPYPQTKLTFRGNALNARANAFYRRHGVTEIEPAAESGVDLTNRAVMTTRYCLKEELGWCPRQATRKPPQEPLFLVDEEGHRYRLRFHCSGATEDCGMDIIY